MPATNNLFETGCQQPLSGEMNMPFRCVCQMLCCTCSLSDQKLEAFYELHSATKRGDIVGVTGHPGKSKKGELSIFAVKFVVLAPCLHMLPKNKLTNQVNIRPLRPLLVS